MLLLLPLLMAGMKSGASEGAGILTVAVGTDGAEGSLARRLAGEIADKSSLLGFIVKDSEEECIKAVSSGEADAAWILHADMEGELKEIAEKGKLKPVARLAVRENDLALGFVKEVFEGRIFPSFIHEVYINYLKNFPEGDLSGSGYPEEAFASQMRHALTFEPEYLDGAKSEDEGLLLTPLRGMLAIWLVMNGFAAMMYFKRDTELGAYDMVPLSKRPRYMFGTEAIVLANAGLVYIIALAVLGTLTNIGYELLTLLVFLACIAGFSALTGLLFSKASSLGVAVPALVFLMIVFCPIFVDIKGLEGLRLVMPPYMYLRAVHDSVYTLYLAGYAAVLAVIALLAGRGRRSDRSKQGLRSI
ncbi:MAG: ABC transporter permease [Lachnospiraceae bacterium]|nr:ABC transporter permease [Lachnospiraceae bacterium]